jgi:hypothetical protein
MIPASPQRPSPRRTATPLDAAAYINNSQARRPPDSGAPSTPSGTERHADPVGLLWAVRVVIALGRRQHGN